MNYISNEIYIYSETESPKNNDQVCLDIKGYQNALFLSCSETPHAITTATLTGIIKNKEWFCHKIMVIVWYFIFLNSLCWNETTDTKS